MENTTENKITQVNADSVYSLWTKEQIQTIRDTVACGATESELVMFLSLATKYNLDPFAHEIWFVKMGTRNTVITGRDGYLKIANRNPHYRGMESDVIYSNDKFIKVRHEVQHAYSVGNRGEVIGAYASVRRDDRDIPTYVYAPLRDYVKRTDVWRQYPHAMILKVAEAMALKRAFSISGLCSQEELGYEAETKMNTQNMKQTSGSGRDVIEVNATEKRDDDERKIQLNQLWERYLSVFNNQKELAINAMKEVTGKNSSKEYTHDDIIALFADITHKEDEKMNAELAAQDISTGSENDTDNEEIFDNADKKIFIGEAF